MPQRLSNVPLADLVPETKLWNDGHGIDLETFAGYHGSFELAIAFGEIFWPAFFEFDECVFRGESADVQFIKTYKHNLRSLKDDREAIEMLHNHLHVWDLFPSAAGDPQPTRDQCLCLARLLREAWEAKLSRDFPDRSFTVVVNEDGVAADEGTFKLHSVKIGRAANKAVHRSRVRPQFSIESQAPRPGDLGRSPSGERNRCPIMIPDFRDDGYLPEGLHLATEAEITFRFGTATSRRRRLALRLRRWIELARTVAARRLFVDGSFMTAKPDPNDVDAVVWLGDDFVQRVSRGDVEAVELEMMLVRRQPEEIFAAEDRRDWDDWVEFFSRTREADGRRKGVVEVEL